jgi:hypothetical protein
MLMTNLSDIISIIKFERIRGSIYPVPMDSLPPEYYHSEAYRREYGRFKSPEEKKKDYATKDSKKS